MFIGIDLGTSGVKLILTTRSGNILKTVSKHYDLIIPNPSWSEQNPEDWFSQTLVGLKEIVTGYENAIQGISFSGQMHGMVLLDAHDRIIRNALLWNDQRTAEEVDFLNQDIAMLLEECGNIALTGLTAPKVLWVKNNEPDHFKRISKIMLPKDYIVYKLSNAFASDVSDLSGTLYFNPKTKEYSKKLLSILGIHEDMLPSIHESYEVVGKLTSDIKQKLGITNDVKIIIGGGDQAVGAIGTGVVNAKECSISLGTSGVVFVASDSFKIDHKSYLQSYAHANGKYHIMAVMLNAAGAIKWWNESVMSNDNYDQFYTDLASSNAKEDLFFLPYLTGERSPINDPSAKGMIYGLQIHHTKKDIDRAIVEGVTFALRDSFELINQLGVKIERVRITGGGAKSRIWVQMISDILGVEVVKIKAEEGPALGAAILAMVGCNAYLSVEEACKEIVELGETYTPSKMANDHYNSKYAKFSKLYPAIKQVIL